MLKKLFNNKIKYNNIITCITNNDIPDKIVKYLDRIYRNKSSNQLFQIIEKKDFYFDNLIHIVCISLVDIDYIFHQLKNINNILVSSDKYNLLCRIYPNKIISKYKKINNISYNEILLSNKYKKMEHVINIYPYKQSYIQYTKHVHDIYYELSIAKNKIYDYGKVIVIMTCYNSEKTIKYSLYSLINQTYNNLEIIIVDDASIDNTVQLINNIIKYISHINIQLFINKENKGCYYSKNIGLKNISTNTKYICFHDSDDISKCNRIKEQVYHMHNNNILISTCLGYYYNIIKIPMISIMIDKTVFDNIGYYNIRRYGADEEYFYRCFSYFVPNYDWNPNTEYKKWSRNGFFKDYKNYKLLRKVLYVIYPQKNSLTKIYDRKSRKKLSDYLINKYKTIIIKKNKKNIYYDFHDYNHTIKDKISNNLNSDNEINKSSIDYTLNLYNTIVEKYGLVTALEKKTSTTSYYVDNSNTDTSNSLSQTDTDENYKSNLSINVPSYSSNSLYNETFENLSKDLSNEYNSLYIATCSENISKDLSNEDSTNLHISEPVWAGPVFGTLETSDSTINTNVNNIDTYIFPATQVHVSSSLIHLENRFMQKFNLIKYNNKKDPSLFFGIYNKTDFLILKNHIGDKYIIWGGTDFDTSYDYRKNTISLILKQKIKLHYAISNDILKRLKKYNLSCERIHINLVDTTIFKKLTEYGNSIFIYNGLKSGNEKIYGKKIYNKVIKKLSQFTFILSNTLNAVYKDMPDIYSRCFIGIRLTKRDGNANMVQEMLQMGIPVIHNGEYPTIKWKNENDIIENIIFNYKNLNIKKIKKNIKKFQFLNILIIFEKDLNIKDGSYSWLMNIIKMFHINSNNITIICRQFIDINSKINILELKKINLNNFFRRNKYDIICYRPYKKILNFPKYIVRNIVLFINRFDITHIKFYKLCKKIMVNSILIKDELEFYNISSKSIDIFPPLIGKIVNTHDISNNITFIYSGTLKKDYLSLELLELFIDLSSKYNFKFNIIFGKIKESDLQYDKKLYTTINKIKKDKKLSNKISIYSNKGHSYIMRTINKAHYGIVIHNNTIDNKQQSTKLIEYLSQKCIPIKSLNYLNCGYYSNEEDLTFDSITELKNILILILEGKIDYNNYEINYEKLNVHLYKPNLITVYNTINYNKPKNISISSKILANKNNSRILISNKIKNRHYTNIMIYLNIIDELLDIHGKILSKFITTNNVRLTQKEKKKLQKGKKKIRIRIFSREKFGIFLDNKINKYYEIRYDKRIFDYEYDMDLIMFNNSKISFNKFILTPSNNYIYFTLKLHKHRFYFIEINITTISDGYLIFNILKYHNGVYKDINRNLHVIQKNNNKIIFTVKIFDTQKYQFRIKPSGRNKNVMFFSIDKLRVHELNNINTLCDDVKIINMDKDIDNYYNLKRLFESHYIITSRAKGTDGYSTDIKKQYDEYANIPYNKLEKNIGRKLLSSPGALGYLYSMKKIFKEAIINNYEYIMICDDDIGIINNFIVKFDDVLRHITKPKILMLGSSQWEWDNIKRYNNYYIPNNTSNGSFCNIYNRTIFEKIYYETIKYNSPFDCNPMKNIFNDNNCFVTYPNLVITQLEESRILLKLSKQRTYSRFKWNKKKYKFPKKLNLTKIIYRKIKSRINDKLFIIGITTFNRKKYLNDCLTTMLPILDDTIDYIIIIADGCSLDGTVNVIKSFTYKKNISLVIIQNANHFIYRQSNSILRYSINFDFSFGFLINDDLFFIKKGWDDLYYKAYLCNKISHIVYFDTSVKKKDHHKINENKTLTSYVSAINCQGALFTFTKNLINNIGYFDENNFKIRGHSHIDFTLRCCRKGYNNIDTLYDITNSNDYIKLNTKLYVSSFNKLPLLLRELHKVDIYELDRRINILNNSSRNKLDINFDIINEK